MRKLLLITGDIAAGKTAFSRQLAERYAVPVFQKDRIKEVLADGIGFQGREESKRLSEVTMQVLYHIFAQTAATSSGDVILEANFHGEELEWFHAVAAENRYETLTLVLRGEAEELHRRYLHRMEKENRHPVHLTLPLERMEDFVRNMEALRREKTIGPSITVDASGFAYQRDPLLLERLDKFMEKQSVLERDQKQDE